MANKLSGQCGNWKPPLPEILGERLTLSLFKAIKGGSEMKNGLVSLGPEEGQGMEAGRGDKKKNKLKGISKTCHA